MSLWSPVGPYRQRTLDGGSGADAPPFTAVLPVAGDATIPLTAASPTPAPPSSDPPSPSRAAAGSKRRSRLVAAGLAAILVAALIFAVATAGGGPETAAQGQPSPAADSVKVPDLVDMDRRSAKQTLVDNGLEMGSRIVTDGNDVVVATEPPAGSTLTKGSEVDLVLAAAHEPTFRPPPETPTEEPKPEKEPKEPKEPKPEKDNSGEGSSDSGQGDDEFFVPPGQETDSSGSSD
ncbi:MAG: PASTA domain-containing protein [Actinomycetota bacterium]